MRAYRTTSMQNFLELLLEPALRYCMRNNIFMATILETTKAKMLDMAARKLEESGEQITVSRLSVMTGINRREVIRIYRDKRPTPRKQSVPTRILGAWGHNKKFLTKTGKPKVLTIDEFRELVCSVSKEFNPATLQFELERTAAIETTARGIKLLSEEFTYSTSPDRNLELASRNVATLVQAVEENITGLEEIKNEHARTEYDNIYYEDLPVIRAWILRESRLLHKRMRDFLSKFDKDMNYNSKKTAGAKVVFASFSWSSSSKDL